MSDGFAAMAAGASQLQQQANTMMTAVQAGQLRIEPDAAANAAKACRTQISRLDGRARDAEWLARRVNFGACDEGNQLSEKFSKKAQGNPNSAFAVIRAYQQALENMAQAIEAAGRMYGQADQGSAQKFKGTL